MLKNNDWYESYETSFLFRVNILICFNMFCSFRVGLKSDLYGTSKFLPTLYFCEVLLVIVQVNGSMRNIKQEHLFDI